MVRRRRHVSIARTVVVCQCVQCASVRRVCVCVCFFARRVTDRLSSRATGAKSDEISNIIIVYDASPDGKPDYRMVIDIYYILQVMITIRNRSVIMSVVKFIIVILVICSFYFNVLFFRFSSRATLVSTEIVSNECIIKYIRFKVFFIIIFRVFITEFQLRYF